MQRVCIKCGHQMPKDNDEYYTNHLASVHGLGKSQLLTSEFMKKKAADKKKAKPEVTSTADISCKDCAFTCQDRSIMVAHRLAGYSLS